MVKNSVAFLLVFLCFFSETNLCFAKREAIGFPRARLRKTQRALLQTKYQIDESHVTLPKGKTVEMVRQEDKGILCLLPDDRCAWLSKDKLRVLPITNQRRAYLRSLFRRKGKLGKQKLPPWLSYRIVRTNSLSLHLVVGELTAAPSPCLVPIVSKNFDLRVKNHKVNWRGRWLPTKGQSFLTCTPLAISGTFIATNPEDLGSPLGPITYSHELIHDSSTLFRSPPARAYLAETDGGRMVISNGGKSASNLLNLARSGELLENELEPGEQVVTLVGGLGLLASKGNPRVWRHYVDKQFQPSYYGGFARRSQVLLGVDKDKLRFFVLFQEGRPRSRLPLTLPQLTQVLVGSGASEVAFADGGDSARMWLFGKLVTPLTKRGHRRRLSNVISFGRPLRKQSPKVQ